MNFRCYIGYKSRLSDDQVEGIREIMRFISVSNPLSFGYRKYNLDCFVFLMWRQKFQSAFWSEGDLVLCLKTSWNRPFPSSPQPPFQSEAKCKVFVMKISFKVSRLDSLWKRDWGELGNGQLNFDERFGDKKKKFETCGQVVLSSWQLQSGSFYVMERTRKAVKYAEMKNARAKRAKLFVFLNMQIYDVVVLMFLR